jgi:hypothetical protein
MKATKFFIVLLAFVGLSLVGCSDQSQTPVSPTDQAPMQKAIITSFTVTHTPSGFTGEGEYNLVPGGKWQMKKFGVIENFAASDPMISGTMVHYLSLTIDAITGEGPCNGSFTLTPANNAAAGGVWEGTYEGYRSKSSVEGEWALPLKLEGHGKGGSIDGMQLFGTSTLTVRADGPTTLPSSWSGVGDGFYKSH